jgi:hypothetical protein
MSETLLPKRFLFRFSIPCRHREKLWGPRGCELDASCRLAGFGALENRNEPAELRAAWNESGLALTILVEGKKQAPWCRDSRLEDSDGMQLWIDTRNVLNVHRAGRFCHRFLFMPTGAGRNLDQPVAQLMPIHRAKEHPKPIPERLVRVASRLSSTGYALDIFLPGEALTGYDPAEHPRLGFNYALTDRELGQQTLGVGSPMPYQDDPSLWATLELVRG